MDEAGNLYVVDTILCAASVFDPSGEFLRQIGSPGDVVGQFARPKGIAIDPDGFAYVVDSAFENCQIFTPDGEIALAFGGAGNLPGSMSLPTQVIISREGTEHFARYTAPGFDVRYLVFVINQFGPWKVNVYGFGRSAGHSYPD